MVRKLKDVLIILSKVVSGFLRIIQGGNTMFNLNKNNNEEEIYSPCIGECIPITQVKDEVFSEKMMGEGVAFLLKDDMVYSPCDGKIMMIAPTKHAFGIKTKAGTEILVHIGLETSEMNGNDFEVLVNLGKDVKVHTPIIKVDMDSIKEKKIDITTPLVITNVEISRVSVTEKKTVDLNTVICKIKKKQWWNR